MEAKQTLKVELEKKCLINIIIIISFSAVGSGLVGLLKS